MTNMESFPIHENSKKNEVISDPRAARQEMKNFWHRKNDFGNLANNMKRQEEERNEWLQKINFHLPDFVEPEKKQNAYSNEVLVATGSSEKSGIFSNLIEARGMKSIPLSEGVSIDEEEEKKIIRCLINEKEEIRGARKYGPQYYAIDLAEWKIRRIYERYKDKTMIASDIVVVEGERVLEKPGTIGEALSMLKSISGKEVKICIGVVMLTDTKIGKKVLLKEGADFTVKLRAFSGKEAEEYLMQIEGGALNIAGAIDYADPMSQPLLDDGKPVIVRPLQLEKRDERTVNVSPEILLSLKDYFRGAPTELIEEMLAERNELADS